MLRTLNFSWIMFLRGIHSRSRQLSICALSTFAFGMLAYAPRYFSTAFSHDSLFIINDESHAMAQIGLGRWLQPFLWRLRGNVNAPWLIGAISLAFVAISCWLITDMLDWDGTLDNVAVPAALVTATPMALAHATYIPWVDAYGVALFLSVLSIWICVRAEGRLWLLAAVPLACSMGLYQAYLQFFTGMAVIILIDRCLRGINGSRMANIALRALVTCVLALGLYWAGTRIATRATGARLLDTYNGITDVGNYTGIDEAAGLVARAWLQPFSWFASTFGSGRLALTVGILAIALAYAVGRLKELSVRRRRLFLALMTVFPITVDVVYIISKGLMHDLMVHAYYLLYVLALLLVKSSEGKKSPSGAILVRGGVANQRTSLCSAVCLSLIFAVVFLQVRYSNQILLQKQLEYEASGILVSRVLDRVEQCEEYVPGETPVAFIGSPSSMLLMERDGYPAPLTGMGDTSIITYPGTDSLYFREVLGYPINISKDDSLASDPRVVAMEPFPAHSSVMMVDRTVVVKYG